MSVEVISRNALARELGLVNEDGTLAERGIAELIRSPLARWGLSPRRTVLRFARDQLRAAGLAEGVPSSSVGAVMDSLQAMGECEEVFIGHERYVAPCAARWIPIGEREGVLLGVGAIPEGVNLVEPVSPNDIARRIRVATEDDLAALHLAGTRRSSLEEWLRPLQYLRYGSRRLRQPVRTDALSLDNFWGLLVDVLTDDGRTVGGDAEIRVLTGPPGAFFGRHDATECVGRWSTDPTDGVWCAYRRGYGDTHWHPVLLSVDGGERRSLDLYDADEWYWSLLARGRATGADERVNRDGARVDLSFPAPRQLLAAMDLVGTRSGAWSWTVSPGAPDPWSLLR